MHPASWEWIEDLEFAVVHTCRVDLRMFWFGCLALCSEGSSMVKASSSTAPFSQEASVQVQGQEPRKARRV